MPPRTTPSLFILHEAPRDTVPPPRHCSVPPPLSAASWFACHCSVPEPFRFIFSPVFSSSSGTHATPKCKLEVEKGRSLVPRPPKTMLNSNQLRMRSALRTSCRGGLFRRGCSQ